MTHCGNDVRVCEQVVILGTDGPVLLIIVMMAVSSIAGTTVRVAVVVTVGASGKPERREWEGMGGNCLPLQSSSLVSRHYNMKCSGVR